MCFTFHVSYKFRNISDNCKFIDFSFFGHRLFGENIYFFSYNGLITLRYDKLCKRSKKTKKLILGEIRLPPQNTRTKVKKKSKTSFEGFGSEKVVKMEI